MTYQPAQNASRTTGLYAASVDRLQAHARKVAERETAGRSVLRRMDAQAPQAGNEVIVRSALRRVVAESPKIEALRKIVQDQQHAEIEGTDVDLFSASAVVGVYDRLGPENQRKFEAMPVGRMVEVAFQLINRQGRCRRAGKLAGMPLFHLPDPTAVSDIDPARLGRAFAMLFRDDPLGDRKAYEDAVRERASNEGIDAAEEAVSAFNKYLESRPKQAHRVWSVDHGDAGPQIGRKAAEPEEWGEFDQVDHDERLHPGYREARRKYSRATAAVYRDGDRVYVDSDFIGKVQYAYPGAVLKHMGMGEFEMETPDGTIQFDRMRGQDFEGQSGRSHLMYDDADGRAVEKALGYMEGGVARAATAMGDETAGRVVQAAIWVSEGDHVWVGDEGRRADGVALESGGSEHGGRVKVDFGNVAGVQEVAVEDLNVARDDEPDWGPAAEVRVALGHPSFVGETGLVVGSDDDGRSLVRFAHEITADGQTTDTWTFYPEELERLPDDPASVVFRMADRLNPEWAATRRYPEYIPRVAQACAEYAGRSREELRRQIVRAGGHRMPWRLCAALVDRFSDTSGQRSRVPEAWRRLDRSAGRRADVHPADYARYRGADVSWSGDTPTFTFQDEDQAGTFVDLCKQEGLDCQVEGTSVTVTRQMGMAAALIPRPVGRWSVRSVTETTDGRLVPGQALLLSGLGLRTATAQEDGLVHEFDVRQLVAVDQAAKDYWKRYFEDYGAALVEEPPRRKAPRG